MSGRERTLPGVKRILGQIHSLHVKGQPNLTDTGKKELKFSFSYTIT